MKNKKTINKKQVEKFFALRIDKVVDLIVFLETGKKRQPPSPPQPEAPNSPNKNKSDPAGGQTFEKV